MFLSERRHRAEKFSHGTTASVGTVFLPSKKCKYFTRSTSVLLHNDQILDKAMAFTTSIDSHASAGRVPPFLSARRWFGASSKPPSLPRLLKKRDFEAIYHCLETSAICTDSWFTNDYSMVGENCLHLLLQYNPPAHLVELMLHQYRKVNGVERPQLTVDYLGRSPLHYALSCHNAPDVVEILASVEEGKTAAMIIDSNRRLPLHNIAVSYRESLEPSTQRILVKAGFNIQKIQANMISNAAFLLKVFPEAMSIRDADKRTPLSYVRSVPQAEELVAVFESAKPLIRTKAPVPLLDILDRWGKASSRVPSELSLDFDEDDVSELSTSLAYIVVVKQQLTPQVATY
jgi:hypothetical protein